MNSIPVSFYEFYSDFAQLVGLPILAFVVAAALVAILPLSAPRLRFYFFYYVRMFVCVMPSRPLFVCVFFCFIPLPVYECVCEYFYFYYYVFRFFFFFHANN